ncbi:neuropeptide Y receptor type 2 [Calliphora vicina]|uniref:neuropeptide Y receptor type 2 n=1 Tax=Calliphora vicina TaxID=7373 RepID=UPI00325B9103
MTALYTTPASELVTATWSALVAQRANTTEPFMATRSVYHPPHPNLMGDLNTMTFSTNAPVPEAERDDVINNNFVQIFFCILYSTVFVLGVFGNVLVCYVVLRNRAMQTVTNIFITNLALSDILLCVLAVPFTPLYTFMGRWAFGRTLCHLVPFAQGCSIYISTLTLTSIAIDRYFVIIYPFHPRMKLSTCIAIIVSIWVISLLATLPYGMYVRVFSEENMQGNVTLEAANISLPFNFTSPSANITYAAQRNFDAHMQVVNSNNNLVAGEAAAFSPSFCEENWPSERYRKVFGSVTTILQFVLPFIIISICYIWISVKLNARARAKPGSKSSRKEEADRDRKKRTNRMLICMVSVFGLSWLPINLVNIFDDFYVKSNEWPFYTLLFFVAHSIAMSSTCYNPFLYAWLNENFRKEFKHVLPCFNPSNNNIINITRGYNRSDRNTCGPRLHHGNGGGGTATRGSSLDNDEQDDGNAITQDTCITKDKLLIIPREPTYGNGNSALSPCLERGVNVSLVQCSKQVEILLNDNDIRHHHHHRHRRNHRDDDDIDSGDEQTIEMRFNETPFISSDNTTGISIMETSTSNDRSGSSERDYRCN